MNVLSAFQLIEEKLNTQRKVRFKDLTAVNVNFTGFWDVTQCSVAARYQSF
jgi:hypothetical protein